MTTNTVVLDNKGFFSLGWGGHAPSEGSRRGSFLDSSGFWSLLVFLCLWKYNSSLCLCHLPCLSVSCPLSIRRSVIEFRVQLHPVVSSWWVTNCICKDPISKQGHSLKLWVDMNLGGTVFNPPHLRIVANHLSSFISRKAEAQKGRLYLSWCSATHWQCEVVDSARSDAIPCIFHYAILLLENQPADSSLESNDIDGRLTTGPPTTPLRQRLRVGLWLCFHFRYGLSSKRMMSSSLFCKWKQSCHVLQFGPTRTKQSNHHIKVGMPGTAFLGSPSSNQPDDLK